MLENWVAVVAELERDAAELGEAAQLIRRRYLREAVDYGASVAIRIEPPIIVPPAPTLHGGRRGGKQQTLRKVKRPQRLPGSVVSSHEHRASEIVALVKRHGLMTTSAIATALKCRDTTVKGTLRRMLEDVELERTGTGPRNWQWRLPVVKAATRTLADVVKKPAPPKAPTVAGETDPVMAPIFKARESAVLQALSFGPADLVTLIGKMPGEVLAQSASAARKATEHTLTRLIYQRGAVVQQPGGRYELVRR